MKKILKHNSRKSVIIILLIVIAIVLSAFWIVRKHFSHAEPLHFETNDNIDLTPEVVHSMQEIGQWEFLAISDEELVDTARETFWGKDELVRIYYGTVRLGIDLSKAKPGWIKANKDSVKVVLPKIQILDENFIDEAQTRAFYEKGSWSEADRKRLYDKAYRVMRQRCYNTQNIKSAERNAAAEIDKLLTAFGMTNINITFEK